MLYLSGFFNINPECNFMLSDANLIPVNSNHTYAIDRTAESIGRIIKGLDFKPSFASSR